MLGGLVEKGYLGGGPGWEGIFGRGPGCGGPNGTLVLTVLSPIICPADTRYVLLLSFYLFTGIHMRRPPKKHRKVRVFGLKTGAFVPVVLRSFINVIVMKYMPIPLRKIKFEVIRVFGHDLACLQTSDIL